jgi:hypothetical protein
MGKVERLTSLEGVFTLGGLSGQHDTVGTVKDGVGDIGNLGSGRSGVVLYVRKWLCFQSSGDIRSWTVY